MKTNTNTKKTSRNAKWTNTQWTKTVSVLLAAAMIGCALTACGGDAEDTPDAAETSATTKATTTSTTAETTAEDIAETTCVFVTDDSGATVTDENGDAVTEAVPVTYVTVTGEDGVAVTDADGVTVTSAVAMTSTTATTAETTGTSATTKATAASTVTTKAATQAVAKTTTTTTKASSHETDEERLLAILKAGAAACGYTVDTSLNEAECHVQDILIPNGSTKTADYGVSFFTEPYYVRYIHSDSFNIRVTKRGDYTKNGITTRDAYTVSLILPPNYDDPWQWPCDWKGIEADCKAYVESLGGEWDQYATPGNTNWEGTSDTYLNASRTGYSVFEEDVKSRIKQYIVKDGSKFIKCAITPDEDHQGHYNIYILHSGFLKPQGYDSDKEWAFITDKVIN